MYILYIPNGLVNNDISLKIVARIASWNMVLKIKKIYNVLDNTEMFKNIKLTKKGALRIT